MAPTPVEVTLTTYELAMAAQVGIRRQLEAIEQGLPDKHGIDPVNGWSVHVQGAAGEMAVAKALNVFWGGSFNTFTNSGDVGDLEVRTRAANDRYQLLIRPGDRGDKIFVLVKGLAPNYTIIGWMYGGLAKREEWAHDYGGRGKAYFVPTDELSDFSELRKIREQV